MSTSATALQFRPKIGIDDMTIQDIAEELKILRDKQGITFAEIGRKTGVDRTSISILANNKKANKDVEHKIREFLKENVDDESNDLKSEVSEFKTTIDLFPTSEFKEALAFCEDMRVRRKMGVVVGYPGSGKTTVLKEYKKRTPGVIYIEAVASMRISDLYEYIAEACGIELGRCSNFKKRQL